MRTKALICDERQDFSIEDVDLPDPSPERMVVRTLYSGVSIGPEFALIRNKLSWGPYPICTGYQGVGIVEEAGGKVDGFKVGDKVYFRDNSSMRLPDGSPVSPVAGTHCAHAAIDPKTSGGVALVPEGVREDAASLFVMPAVGLNGVDMANPRMGQTVVVHGVGAIGIGVVAACAHRGCVVIAVDLNEKRLALAREFGADHTINGSSRNVEEAVRGIAPDLADAVFESTGIPECIDPAIALCKWRGTFVWMGNYGEKPISMRFLQPHGKQVSMCFPCNDGVAPCRRAVLKNMAMGTLRWERTITHRVEPDEAPALYDRINKNRADDVIGAVIHWSD